MLRFGWIENEKTMRLEYKNPYEEVQASLSIDLILQKQPAGFLKNLLPKLSLPSLPRKFDAT